MPKGPKGEGRPADVIGNAVRVMRIATGGTEEEIATPQAEARTRPPRPGRCLSSALALALALAAAGAAAAAAGSAAADDDDDVVTLWVGGREGARVGGWCRVATPGGGELRLDLDEAVPVERRWRGAVGLRCVLDARGAVTVEAARGGARSRASTTGGRVAIDLR